VGNAGEGGSLSSGRLFNEGVPLVWVMSKDPIAGTRPFLCLVLDCSDSDYVGQSRER
jgi:hypothetical protein